MSITKRQEQILELLRENTFLTVEKLSKYTYTSPSSIRRDLTRLQNLSLIKRTHGGASIHSDVTEAPHLNNRMTENIVGKKKIAKKAAALIHDGQSIMLDGSSTVAFLIPHIAKHKDITLFTYNMMTAISAINYGIATHCLGGTSLNRSAVLAGASTYKAVAEIHPDIAFFSSRGLSQDGIISDPTPEENYIRKLMLENAKTSVFLCNSEKFGNQALYALASLDEVDYCVFDKPWSELKTKCKML